MLLNRWRRLRPGCFYVDAENAGIRSNFVDLDGMSWSARPALKAVTVEAQIAASDPTFERHLSPCAWPSPAPQRFAPTQRATTIAEATEERAKRQVHAAGGSLEPGEEAHLDVIGGDLLAGAVRVLASNPAQELASEVFIAPLPVFPSRSPPRPYRRSSRWSAGLSPGQTSGRTRG